MERDLCITDILSMDKQLEGRVFHPCPPEWRLDPVYLHGGDRHKKTKTGKEGD